MNYAERKKKLKKALDKERFEHTLGVMYTASCLAMAHGVDMEDARLAGLLHDCAKCIPNDEKIALCEKNQILITPIEYENPSLLHAKLGALLAEKEYEVTNPDILHAISVHTTGLSGPVCALIILLGPVGAVFGLIYPVLIWSRVTLKKHTMAQAITGGVFGFIMTAVEMFLFIFMFNLDVGNIYPFFHVCGFILAIVFIGL